MISGYWAQVTGTMVMLSVVIWKGGNEKEIKSSVLAILNLSCREDSPEEIKETNRFFLRLALKLYSIRTNI